MAFEELYTQPIFWAALVGVLIGLAGSVLPGIPGVPLIFLSALLYAYFTGFEVVGGGVILTLGIFAAIAFVADFVFTAYGARRFGASNWGTTGGAIGGLVGAIAGFFFAGVGALFGLIAGTIGGVFLGEYLRREREKRRSGSSPATPEGRLPREGEARPEAASDWRRTSRAAGGVLVGYVVSAVVQGLLALASVALFVYALFN
ncbi:hypothetical protein RradSPS_1038 [Rubrobacter radiotolerans]|uniref:DUF456 domain-containing protein n=1 Tax=Rubrobacter radiotolerans TaxID=42256 RepID=A0A023X271_RUBRA|nr:DUF456 domain-containing protein [Rubrobacter radiotolerans]AHY46321.1 hypothetical protein RradSPS_1038 [Rubrobacter radiotolerans]MDX5893728.1 DUF456 domain-containing protein [Rubrobacter radiotolerans]SMC04372.1 hypothetical protein SAMN00767673_1033 [Rubrobacter radiotolerans DSM 5868]